MIPERLLQIISRLTPSRIERFILLRYSPQHNEFIMCYDSDGVLSPYVNFTESCYPSLFDAINKEKLYWLDKEDTDFHLTRPEIELFSMSVDLHLKLTHHLHLILTRLSQPDYGLSFS